MRAAHTLVRLSLLLVCLHLRERPGVLRNVLTGELGWAGMISDGFSVVSRALKKRGECGILDLSRMELVQ